MLLHHYKQVADISKQCNVIVPEDLKRNVDKEAHEFRVVLHIVYVCMY